MYQLTPGGLHPLGFFFVRIKSLRKRAGQFMAGPYVQIARRSSSGRLALIFNSISQL
jgi:hypothetical protein